MATVRQSDLKDWARCPLAWRYKNIDKLPRTQGGSSVFGSVLHELVLYLETTKDIDGTLEAFAAMWLDPVGHLGEDKGRIDYYERGRSWKKFNDMGPRILTDWWALIQWDSDVVLAREYEFDVPIGDGHRLHGTVDKLALRYMAALDSQVVLVSDYKDLALDTPLPTPSGWTTMGDVQIGDEVIGGDGKPCRVTAKSQVYRSSDCYRVTFDDTSSVVAGAEHLWAVEMDAGPKILTTVQMQENLFNPATTRKRRQLRIPNVATDLPPVDLPVDPYVLGAWLGDGSKASGVICKPLPALFAEIRRRGYEVGPDIGGKDHCEARTVYGLSKQLRLLGVLHNKHVPVAYLRASMKQRLDLLRGIMDTDGHWNVARRRCVLNTTSERFARDTAELVRTLGWKATTFATKAWGFGKVVPAWQTWFTPVDADVFLARVPPTYRRMPSAKSRRRLVMSVESTPTVPTQCISVDSPDQTYLCGEQMVPTHNTSGKRPTYEYLEDDLQFSAYAFSTLQPEFWENLPDGPAMYERLKDLPRRGEWVHLQDVHRMDAGPREQHQYNRLIYAVNAMAQSVALRIFVPDISGATCKFCEFRNRCGLPDIPEVA